MQENAVRVSVIIPVYNAQKYLARMLDSLLAQTMREFEVICVDDGSTDDSLAILREYSARDDRISVRCQKNQHAGVARNNGMSAARGAYLLFLDSDDETLPELIRSVWETGARTGADVILYEALQRGEVSGKEWRARTNFLPDKEVFAPADVSEHLFTMNSSSPWNKAFRREFVQENGLQFQSLHNANDVYFSAATLMRAKKITAIQTPLVIYYNEHTQNLQSQRAKDPCCYLKAYAAAGDDLARLGLKDLLKNAYLRALLGSTAYASYTFKDPVSWHRIFEGLLNFPYADWGLFDRPDDFYENPQLAENAKGVLRAAKLYQWLENNPDADFSCAGRDHPEDGAFLSLYAEFRVWMARCAELAALQDSDAAIEKYREAESLLAALRARFEKLPVSERWCWHALSVYEQHLFCNLLEVPAGLQEKAGQERARADQVAGWNDEKRGEIARMRDVISKKDSEQEILRQRVQQRAEDRDHWRALNEEKTQQLRLERQTIREKDDELKQLRRQMKECARSLEECRGRLWEKEADLARVPTVMKKMLKIKED